MIFDVLGEHRPGSHGASADPIRGGRNAAEGDGRRGRDAATASHASSLAGAGATLAACHSTRRPEPWRGGACRQPLPAVRLSARAPRRILLLGGTGFIGPQLVHAALAGGHSVSMLNRGRRTPNQNAGDFARVEALRGDRSQPDAYASLAGKRWDVVVDTATNLRWTREAVAALRGATDRFMYVSSTGVFLPYLTVDIPEDGPVPLTDTPPKDPPSYGVLKAQSENLVREGFPQARSHHPPGLHRRPRRHLGSLHLLAGAPRPRRRGAGAGQEDRSRAIRRRARSRRVDGAPHGRRRLRHVQRRRPGDASRPSRSFSTGSPRWPPRRSPTRGSRTTSGSRPTRSASPRRRTAPGSPMRFRG